MIETPIDVVKKLDIAFNNKDIEAVLECYEDQATVVAEPGRTITGKVALRKFFETIFNFNGIAKQEKMKTIETDNIALFISKWNLTTKSSDGNLSTKEFIATCVFHKDVNGKWRLIIDNSFGPEILNF